MLLSKCLDEWKQWRSISGCSENTIYTQGTYAAKFIRSLPARVKSVSQVKPDMIHAHINEDDGKSVNTKKFALASLRSMFDYAVAREYINNNPSSIVKVNKRKLTHDQLEQADRVPFTIDEFEMIIDKLPYFYRQATAISWYTGLRLRDIAGLEWSSIKKDHIVVYTDKTGKKVALPMDHMAVGLGEIRKYLSEIKREDRTYCFPTAKAVVNNPTSRSGVTLRFIALIEKYGITGKSFHCLRHAFVTRLSNMGIEIKDIAELVGHSSTETTEGYNHGV